MKIAEQKGSRGCADFRTLLEGFSRGELTRESTAAIERHVAECVWCRESVNDAKACSAMMRDGYPPIPEPGPRFTQEVMAQVREMEECRGRERIAWRPLQLLAGRLALSAALALGVLLAYVFRPGFALPPTALGGTLSVTTEIVGDAVQQPASGDDVLLAIAERDHGK
jgi:anti-sigma factor RsiW